jgi:hypothetical protein
VYVRISLWHFRETNDIHFFLEKDKRLVHLTSYDNKTIFTIFRHQKEAIFEDITHSSTKNYYDDSQLVAVKYLIEKSNELINDGWKLKLTH